MKGGKKMKLGHMNPSAPDYVARVALFIVGIMSMPVGIFMILGEMFFIGLFMVVMGIYGVLISVLSSPYKKKLGGNDRIKKPKLLNYLMYVVLISISLLLLFFDNDQNMYFFLAVFSFIAAILSLDFNWREYWREFNKPVGWRLPKLREIISLAIIGLSFTALIFLVRALEETGQDLYDHIFRNKPVVICLWLIYILLPLLRKDSGDITN